ncbi:MAG: RbsD/FucU family protein [Anaerolineae bacterium]
MLKTKLLHPEILAALGAAGHSGRVLVADGNYPFCTRANPAAPRVYLNLAPGLLKVTDVLKVLAESIPVEAAHVMQPADGSEPPIWAEFREILPEEVKLQALGRFEFYDVADATETALVVATGEQRIYANILLTIGVVAPGDQDATG